MFELAFAHFLMHTLCVDETLLKVDRYSPKEYFVSSQGVNFSKGIEIKFQNMVQDLAIWIAKIPFDSHQDPMSKRIALPRDTSTSASRMSSVIRVLIVLERAIASAGSVR